MMILHCTVSRTAAGATAGLLLAAALWPCLAAADTAQARADLGPASGSAASGTVAVRALAGGGVHLDAKVSGLTPGVHGFHIHETGDCSAVDASSAKGHFNPTGRPHGSHLGDLPDLTADASGTASLSADVPGLTLDDAATSIMGRAFVVHADPDDHVSQPAGNSGKRVACGVIRAI
ncbi:MAG TPA: superoxide dismutase family protein [Burkholderiaceae bacterium]|nr:superoxide dismutase family protein [Burkholderiaceae bacterium]